MHLRSISDLGPGQALWVCDSKNCHSQCHTEKALWLTASRIPELVRSWRAVYPAFSYIFTCRLHGLVCFSQNTEHMLHIQWPERLCFWVRDGRACCLWNVLQCASPMMAETLASSGLLV